MWGSSSSAPSSLPISFPLLLLLLLVSLAGGDRDDADRLLVPVVFQESTHVVEIGVKDDAVTPSEPSREPTAKLTNNYEALNPLYSDNRRGNSSDS